MRREESGKSHVYRGTAVFNAPGGSLWDTRQAAKRAALAGQKERGFVVTLEDMYYPHMLDALLSDRERLRKEALALGDAVTGRDGGRIRCAYLWESEREGVLLHRDGAALLCAYVPLITYQTAQKERELALTLARLANQAEEMPVCLEKRPKPGRQSLRDILRYLSERLDG